MGRQSKYGAELQERAVRMVAEIRPDYPSQWAAICAVAGKLGIGAPETVRTWVRRAEVDDGKRPGTTTEQAAEVAKLKREVAELRRANEILKAAAIFFGPSSTGQGDGDRVHPRAQRPQRARPRW
jgi:transposase